MAIYRYPGITPFTQNDQNVFWGREDDIQRVFNSIVLNQSTVLVGRSGVGKTSLIYAGVLPMILKEINEKKQDKRYFLNIPIRIGMWKKEEAVSLIGKIKQLVPEKKDGTGFLSFLPDNLRASLWYKFKQLQFEAVQKKENTIFLLVFDQLEELFTYPYDQFREMIHELKNLISTNLPDDVRNTIDQLEQKNPDLLTDEETSILYKPVPIKFLFAVRSDKLSLLIRLRGSVETILQNPIELRPLSTDQAYKAIKVPASEINGDFLTDPFEIEDDAVKEICFFLANQPKSDPESNFEDLYIEPFMLQIICQHIERNLVPNDADKRINKVEIGDPNNIIKNYYQNVLKQLSLDEQTSNKVQQMIEEGMIYEPDQRRLILYEEVILQEYMISRVLLDKLVDAKLLRRLSAVGTSASYELSHDWLVIPILNAKKDRLGLSDPDKFNASLNQLEEEVKKNPNDYNVYKRMGDYYYFLQNYKMAVIKYSDAIKVKTGLGIKGSDVELFFNRGDCYYKLREHILSNQDLEVVLESEPNHLLANFYTGYNYQMTKNNEMAEKFYHKVIAIDPAYVTAYYNLGLLYKSMNLPDESEQAYLKCLALNPKDHEAYYNLALLCTSKNERERSIEYLLKSIEIQPTFLDAVIELALTYSDLQQYDNAISKLKDLLKQDPGNNRALKTLGYIYYIQKDYQEAVKFFYKAIAQGPNDYESPYYLGIISNDLQKYADAVIYFEKALQLKPDHINSLLEKGYAHRMLQQIESSLKAYNAVLALDPNNENALKNIATISKYAESENDLVKALELNPDDTNSLYNLGILANNKDKYPQAVEYFSRLLVLDPKNINGLIELAYANLGLNNEDKAIECYKKIVELDSENIIAYRALGKMYSARKEYELAEVCFIKISQLDPRDYDSFYRLGVMANNQNQFEKAAVYLGEAIKVKPDLVNGHIEKAFALSSLGRNEEAIACYNDILALDPENADAYHNIGIIYDIMGNSEQSGKYFLKAFELNPKRLNTNYELGVLSHKAKNFPAAIQYFERCISLDPEYPKPYDYLAYYYMQVKQYDKAIKYYSKMVQLDPANGDNYYKLGTAFQKIAHYDEALPNLEQAIKLNPKDYEAAYCLGGVCLNLNKKADAIRYFQQVLTINPEYTKAQEQLKLLVN